VETAAAVEIKGGWHFLHDFHRCLKKFPRLGALQLFHSYHRLDGDQLLLYFTDNLSSVFVSPMGCSPPHPSSSCSSGH
jgi:hypothetical protein